MSAQPDIHLYTASTMNGWKPVIFLEEAGVEYDLTHLRNGVTRTLSSGNLESGVYRQIRLHLVSRLSILPLTPLAPPAKLALCTQD